MTIDTKEIIDNHFRSNYDYYKRVCFRYCKGGKCHEDLLHKCYEEFLKVKQEVILKFAELNRLYNIGLKIIRSLFQKRFHSKKQNNGRNGVVNSSELFDLAYSGLSTDIDFKLESYAISNSESDYVSLDNAINELLSDPIKSTPVIIFLQANETSINKVSEESRISRFYLTKEYNKGKEYLKQHIHEQGNK